MTTRTSQPTSPSSISQVNSVSGLNLWGAAGLAALAALLAVQFSTAWEWSLMMDDVSYLSSMPQAQNVWVEWIDQIKAYWSLGRFYPVKYLMNLLKWRYLPLNPSLFHWVNTIVLLMTLALAAGWATRLSASLTRKERLNWIVFFLGFGLIHRPLLDVLALNSIGEGWAALFMAAGLCGFPRRPFLYRPMFLLAALSKEPAAASFAAAAASQFLFGIFWTGSNRRRAWIAALVDGLCFVGLLAIYHEMHKTGSYLGGYQILNVDTVRSFLICSVKVGIGLAPLIPLAWAWKARENRPTETPFWSPETSFCVLFAIGYLTFVAGNHTVAGYLLIPASLTLAAVAMRWIFIYRHWLQQHPKHTFAILLLFVLIYGTSFVRYVRYIDSINMSSRLLTSMLATGKPRLVLLNAPEASGALQIRATELHAPVRVRNLVMNAETEALIREYREKDIVLVELTGYFGGISDRALTQLNEWVGGWKTSFRQGPCRVFVH